MHQQPQEGGRLASATSGTPKSGGTLKVSFFPDNPTFSCIDPFQVYWIESRTIIRNYADSLTDQDPKTGKIVPWLAKSWKISPDGLTYTFHLRDGVTFSNGKKVDAQAVADDAAGLDRHRQGHQPHGLRSLLHPGSHRRDRRRPIDGGIPPQPAELVVPAGDLDHQPGHHRPE